MALSKEEIIERLSAAKNEFLTYCGKIDDAAFLRQPAEKWSIAQHVKHLTISATSTRLAFSLPKFIVRLYSGRPNRASRTYEELVEKYKLKLQQGGKASGIFIPKPIPAEQGKQSLLESFASAMDRLAASLAQNWKEDQLDQYLAPHPLLGKVTLRELAYFTIHHTHHHLGSIRDRMDELERQAWSEV